MKRPRKEAMLNVRVEHIGELAVIDCEGRILQSKSATKLCEVVTSQTDARIVVLELSALPAMRGGGSGTFVTLQRGSTEHHIRFPPVNPSKSVRNRINQPRAVSEFYIPPLEKMRSL